MSWSLLLRQHRDRPQSLEKVAVAQAERGSNLLLVIMIVLGAIAVCAIVAAAIAEFG